MATSSLERAVETRMRDHGIRLTQGRRAVVAALAATDGPLSAAELHDELVSVPLSSLYRSLAALEAIGVVEPHNAVRGVTRYELAEWLRGHHHHLICTSCGGVEDIDLDPDREALVQDLVSAIGAIAHFAPSGHALEIEGRCERCS